jgi:signal transduction histidine kinase
MPQAAFSSTMSHPSSLADDTYAQLAELAGGFIHEIKNHLGTLGLHLQLLAEDFQEPRDQRERRSLTRVQKLQVECQRLTDIANDFLRFARIKDLPLTPAGLGKVIEEMIDFFTPTARAANIDIKAYLPADLPAVALNADMFKQALLNLMLNAEQAMPDGGSLTIQAARESSDASENSTFFAASLSLLTSFHGSLRSAYWLAGSRTCRQIFSNAWLYWQAST